MSRSLVATFIAVLLTVAGVATPARATTADAPTDVTVTQSGLVVSAVVTVPEGETVGTVTVAVGSDSPVAVTEVSGEYPVTLTRSDFGKGIVFSATAVGDGLDESAATDSAEYTFRSAVAPTSVSVSQSGLTLTATPTLATGTTLGAVTVQVGTGSVETVTPVDDVYSITLPRTDLGKSIVFSATANETGFPESDATSSSPFTFAVADAPSSVTVTQSGLVFTGHVTVGASQTIGTVTVQVGTADPETVTAVGGNYTKTIDRADLGKSIVFWATATESGKAESVTTASSAFTSASALAPTAVTVTQSGLVVTGHVTVGTGDSIGTVTVKVGDGTPESVTPVDGVYSKTLTRAQLGSIVIFSATATSTDLPESDPTSSDPFTFSAAAAPSSVTVTQSGLVVSGHVTVESGASVGTVTAAVGTADPVAVTAVDGEYPLTLTRADAGKTVVFTAVATASGKAVSDSTSSEAFTFALAAAPTSVVVTQNNLTVSAAVTFAEGTTSGGVTVEVGTAEPVSVSPVDGSYSVTLTRDDLGKAIVFSAVGAASGLPDSEPVSNSSFTFSAAAAPSSVTVSRDGMTLTAEISKLLSQEIGTVTVQIGTAEPEIVSSVAGAYAVTLLRADLGKDVVFRATTTETGKAESSVTASAPFNLMAATAPTSVTATQDGFVVSADVAVGYGESIGTVTVQVGAATAEVVSPVDGNYSVTLTRDDLGKEVVFTATATESGKEESDSTTSNAVTFSAATAPTSITVSQTGLVVTADVTVAIGEGIGGVTATVGTDDPTTVTAIDGVYSLTLTRADLGKSVTFAATATSAGKIISDAFTSEPFTFSAAAAPSAVTLSQSGLVVTAAITVASGDVIGTVTATVGSADPVTVTAVDDVYSIELTRADAGKAVVFTATATSAGKAVSDATSSDPLTFGLAASPTAIVVSQSGLVVSAAVTFAEGTTAGTVTATVGTDDPITVEPTDAVYSLTLTRADLTKSVTFSATATQAGLPDSDAFTSEPFTFSAAAAPSAVTATQNGLVVTAGITVASGDAIGTVTATVGSADPVVVTPVDDVYSVELTRADAGKTVVFAATATSAGKAVSDATSSDPLTFGLAASPTAIVVSQSGLVVSATVTFAEGTTAGTVTATVGTDDPIEVTTVDDVYSITLTRADLTKTVTFSAVGTQSGLPDSDAFTSEPFTFSAAAAPSAVTLSQSGLVVTAAITVASGDAIGTVTVTVGNADPVVVTPVDDVYSVELTRADAGKAVVFAATATSTGKAVSDATSSDPLTFGLAAAPTAIVVTQDNLTVSAAVTFAEGTSAGTVTATVGTEDPIQVTPVDDVYSITLTRADLTKTVTFSAVGTQSGLPDSDAFTSEPFTFTAASAPSAVTLSQSGLVVTASITVASGDAIGTVTATVGDADPVTVTAVDDVYSVELIRADAGKSVTFTATATSAGKAVSDATSSDPLTFGLAASPTAIVVTQDNLTVSAAVTFAEGTTAGTVTATVGDADPVTVEATDDIYSIILTRADLTKSVTFSATATQAGLPDSDAFTSEPFTFSAASAPSAVTLSQSGLVVTAGITVGSGDAIGTVTATVGDADPVVVTPVDDVYSIELTRADAGKSVSFTATATSAGKAVSDATSSDPLTFGLAASPTAIVVSQSGLVVSAAVTFAEGTTAGTVTATVGTDDPIEVTPVDDVYSITLTRADLTKTVTFSAVGTQSGLPDSDAFTSEPFIFSAATAPISVTLSQSGLVVTAAITVAEGDAIGTVTAVVGDADPVAVTPVDDVYSVELTRADAGKAVVFTATATSGGKAESDSASSDPLTFGLAASPTAIVVSQSGLTVSAAVTFAEGTTAGTVTAVVGDADPVTVEPTDDVYSITLTRADLTKAVTFSATATQAGLPDSDAFTSEPFTFSAADAPSAVTATQNGLFITAAITVAEGDAIGTVTATVGDADPIVVTPVDDVYSIELMLADAGKTVTFTATATSTGKAESDSASSDPLTFGLTASPTAIVVSQDNLTVSAAITFAEGTSAGTVTVTVGTDDPIEVTPVDDVYSVTLTRADLTKSVTFSATATQAGLPDSDPFTSEPFIFSAADAPSAVTVSQAGLVVTAEITVAEGDAIGTVTAVVGDADPVAVTPVDDVYSVELTRADAGKSVVFTATATSSGKAESDSASSDPFTFGLASAPTAIVVTQDNLTVSAAVTFAEGTTAGTVTAIVGTDDPIEVTPVDDIYSITLTRADLTKSVTFSAVGTQAGLPDSDAFTSEPFIFSAADAPSAVTASQNGLVVTAAITVAEGDAIGTVTATVGDADPVVVTPVDDVYSVELTREDAGKAVVFTATATSSGKAESDSASSEPFTFGLASAPTAIVVTQDNLTVSAAVTFAEGTTTGTVTATVGTDDPIEVTPVDDVYSITLTRDDLTKSVVFSATATQAGLPDSDAFTSEPFTFSAADAPSAVTATQNGLVVTAGITVAEGDAIGTVTATVGDADPVVVTPVDDVYSVELTREDAGKAVVFTATATSSGKAESDSASSEPFTFGLTAAPTAIVVTQDNLTVSAAVTFAEGTTAGTVTATVGTDDPIEVTPVDDVYSITLTREDLTKTVTFSAVGTQSGLPDSDAFTSEPFIFSAADAPSAVTVSQSGLVVTAEITVAEGDAIGTVTATVGDADPVTVDAVADVYSVELTREDAGKAVTFTATATSAGRAESDSASSEPFTFGLAAAPTAIVVTQDNLTVSAAVTFAEGTTAGTVTATVGDADPVTVDPTDDVYSITLTREDLGKDVVFSATATQDGLPDSDAFTSEPFIFSAADAPSAVTVSQAGLVVTAEITVAEGDAIGSVTATVGDADPVTVDAVADVYSIELTREDAGKSVVFTATATSSGKAESDSASSEPFTFALAASPTAIVVTQDNLTVSAAITFAEGTTAGTVTATVGDADPVTVDPTDDVYSLTLTREDLGKDIVFTAVGVADGLPDSDPFTSEPFAFAASTAPTTVTVTQNGYDLTANIEMAPGQTIGTVTVQIGTGDPTTVDATDGDYVVTIDPDDATQEVIFSATALTDGLAESEATASEAFTLVTAEAPTAVTLTQVGLNIQATIEVGTDQVIGSVTATVGTDDPIAVDPVEGAYAVTLTREQIGQDITFSATATQTGLIESAATTSEALTVGVAAAPTAVTATQAGMDIVVAVELSEGTNIGTVTAVVDGAESVTVPMVDSEYRLTLTRSDFGKPVVISATGAATDLPESDAVDSEEVTFQVSASPKTLFISQNALTLTVAGFVPCATDPATYGSLGTVTMSVDGGAPETLTTVAGKASKTLTRSELGKSVVVTGTGVCGTLPESDSVTRAPYVFRIAASPTSIAVTQSNLTVIARPAVGRAQKVGIVTVSIDGAEPTVVTRISGAYRVTLTRDDFGKSLVFTATATLARYADSEPTASTPYIFTSAVTPTAITVSQTGLKVTARVTVATRQTVGVVTVTVDGGEPVTLKASNGSYSKTLTRGDLGKSVVFTATSKKTGLPESDALLSSPFEFAAALAPTSVLLSQTGLTVTATIVVPEGQAVGTVYVSVNGATPTLVRYTSSGYVKRLTKAANGKSLVFYVTSTKTGKAVSDQLASSPLVFVG